MESLRSSSTANAAGEKPVLLLMLQEKIVQILLGCPYGLPKLPGSVDVQRQCLIKMHCYVFIVLLQTRRLCTFLHLSRRQLF
jgi:hypothetical protein